MVGTINLSLSQQLDEYGQPLSGGQLYIIQAGTVNTPQNAYQDTGLSIALPNPITLDAAGRIPQFFLADGQIKVRLQDQYGVVKFTADNLLVIGPTGGGGTSGGSIDQTTVLSTGDIKTRYDTAILGGFVRCNGKSIGSTLSPATEFADPTTQALFLFLWNKDATLAVSGGRGASASADWTANKAISLPDMRGCVLAALDDMGNSAAGRLTSSFFGLNATVLGARSGLEYNQLTVSTVPSLSFSGGTGTESANHTHSFSAPVIAGANNNNGGGGGAFAAMASSNTGYTTSTESVSHYHAFSGSTNGGGAAHANCQPTMLLTVYMKL